MKITVVTPSYNQGEFIKRTIDSVLSQGIEDLEYIVMDGGSSDETVDILKSYGDKIIWKSEKDKGQTDAVNKGIRESHGEIIGWLNSDDVYYPGAIKKVLDFFEKNPEINIVYGNANHIRKDDSIIGEYSTEDFDYERLTDICFICQPALFFRKKIVDKYGYLDDTLQYCMDYEYWLRLGKSEKFYRLNELLAGSRLYAENKTLSSRIKVHEEILAMQEKKWRKATKKWVYGLAHITVEEMGIPEKREGKPNPEFFRMYAKLTIKQFLKHYKYIPWHDLKRVIKWYLLK